MKVGRVDVLPMTEPSNPPAPADSVSLVYGEPSSFSLCFLFLVEWCFCVLFFILILFLRFSVIPHSMWDLKFLDQGLNFRALRWKTES